MPIYEYACSSCHHNLDVLQKFSDPVLVDCPECGKPKLQKQLSAPKFRLKGKGWYETDFKTGDQRNIAGDAGSKDSKDGKDGKDGKESKDNKDTKTDKPAKAEPAAAKSDSGSGKSAGKSDSKAKSA